MNRCATNEQWTAESLSARVELLERRNEVLSKQYNRLKATIGAMLCLVCFGCIWALLPSNSANAQGQRAQNIVRATGFVIVDKAGMERGSFSYNDAEQTAILALESSKDARLTLNCGRDNVGLRLTHGKNDINLGCSPKGGTYIEMFDKDGKSIFEQRKP